MKVCDYICIIWSWMMVWAIMEKNNNRAKLIWFLIIFFYIYSLLYSFKLNYSAWFHLPLIFSATLAQKTMFREKNKLNSLQNACAGESYIYEKTLLYYFYCFTITSFSKDDTLQPKNIISEQRMNKNYASFWFQARQHWWWF